MRSVCIGSRRVDDPPKSVQQDDGPGTAPRGHYYSVDLSWEEYNTRQNPQWYRGQFIHRIELGSERMLFIRSPNDLAAFHEEYQLAHWATMRKINPYEARQICWRAVAARWDGIEIAPCLTQMREEPYIQWYGSWKPVAQGVVWRPRDLKTELVGHAFPVKQEEDPYERPDYADRPDYEIDPRYLMDERMFWDAIKSKHLPSSSPAIPMAPDGKPIFASSPMVAGLKKEFLEAYEEHKTRRFMEEMEKMRLPSPMVIMDEAIEYTGPGPATEALKEAFSIRQLAEFKMPPYLAIKIETELKPNEEKP